MNRFFQVAVIFCLVFMMVALCFQCANGQSGIIKKRGQWTIFVITDTTVKPTLYDTSWASSPDTILYPVYLHDTIRIHDTSYAQFNVYDTIRIRDTINNCSPTLSTVFTTQSLPTTSQTDGQPITLGIGFKSSMPGYIKGIRFYKTAKNTGTHIGYLYSSAGAILATGVFSGESATGWQTLPVSIPITAGTSYVAAYYSPTGQYSFTAGGLPVTNGVLSASSGVYNYGNKFPTLNVNNNYWVDLIYSSVP